MVDIAYLGIEDKATMNLFLQNKNMMFSRCAIPPPRPKACLSFFFNETVSTHARTQASIHQEKKMLLHM